MKEGLNLFIMENELDNKSEQIQWVKSKKRPEGNLQARNYKVD